MFSQFEAPELIRSCQNAFVTSAAYNNYRQNLRIAVFESKYGFADL